MPQTGNYLMAQIPVNHSTTHFYTVEVRRKTGYDIKLPGAGIIIHEVQTYRPRPRHAFIGHGERPALGELRRENRRDRAGRAQHIAQAPVTL